MKMRDLSFTSDELEERKTPSKPVEVADNQPEYPYGLRISLDESTLNKLPGINKKDVDDSFTMKMRVKVVGKSSEQRDGKADRRMELQITDACVDDDMEDFTEGFDDKEEGEDGKSPYFDTRK